MLGDALAAVCSSRTHFTLGVWHWITWHMDKSAGPRRQDHFPRYPEQLRLRGSIY